MDVEFSVGDPFAAIDEITPESPAASDGLQLGDLVVQFGSVAKGGDLLSRLSYEAQSNVGKPVPVAIMRHGSPLTLTVTPRQWQGRGLLGYVDLHFDFDCSRALTCMINNLQHGLLAGATSGSCEDTVDG